MFFCTKWCQMLAGKLQCNLLHTEFANGLLFSLRVVHVLGHWQRNGKNRNHHSHYSIFPVCLQKSSVDKTRWSVCVRFRLQSQKVFSLKHVFFFFQTGPQNFPPTDWVSRLTQDRRNLVGGFVPSRLSRMKLELETQWKTKSSVSAVKSCADTLWCTKCMALLYSIDVLMYY